MKLDPNGTKLIGVVHLLPLPGSPGWTRESSMAAIVERALRDGEACVEGGCDGIIVENMGDVPYLRGHVYAETIAAMTVATAEVVKLGLPTGVQVLAAANREALAVAHAAGASFIRAEAFAYAHVADEGWLDATAAEVTRVRSAIGARVDIWTDIKKKHSAHAVTADLSVADVAHGTAFCGADVLIVTGSATGQPADPDDVRAAASAHLPVAVGSGIDIHNITRFTHAQALIVGTWIKAEGNWRNRIETSRVRQLSDALKGRA